MANSLKRNELEASITFIAEGRKVIAIQGRTWSYCDLRERQVTLPTSVALALEPLLAAADIKRIILFGSRAVGDHDERSDFDVAISAPDISRQKLALLRDLVGQSRTLFKISISVLEGMPPNLKDRVISQGVILYERT